MITIERLEEMLAAEVLIVRRPFQHPRVKANAQELADALGELIERRQMRMYREPPTVSDYTILPAEPEQQKPINQEEMWGSKNEAHR